MPLEPSEEGQRPVLLRFLLPGLFVVILFSVLVQRRPEAVTSGASSATGEAMGTTWSVVWVPPEAQGGPNAEDVRDVVTAALESVTGAMSTYLASSELSRFNAREDDAAVTVSRGLLEVMTEATRVSRLTSGAFDVTVAPLVRLWGFGANPNPDVPSEAEVQEARGRTGFEKVEIDVGMGTLRKVDPRVTCDLSAIAKGFAVDQATRALEGLGIRAHMVELGGEVRARGERPGGGAWRIGVETPDGGSQDVRTVVPLRDAALATSGDYRNFVVVGGERISHTIDPRTGRPLEHPLASVSVIHSSCMTADALATGLNVLGPGDGYALAEREGWAALFIERASDGTFRERVTSKWRANLEQGAPGGAD